MSTRRFRTILFTAEDQNPNSLFSGAYALIANATSTDDIPTLLNSIWPALQATTATKLTNGLADIKNRPGATNSILDDFTGAKAFTTRVAFVPSASYDVYLLGSKKSSATAWNVSLHRDAVASRIESLSITKESELNPDQITHYTATVEGWKDITTVTPPAPPVSVAGSSRSSRKDASKLQKRKAISLRLQTVPAAVQQLRKRIIDNANFMVQEMQSLNFIEVSEIIRVCTALGLRRAQLRGLDFSEKTVNTDSDIDRYIHRFNMLGALPFQDQNQPTTAEQQNWIGGGRFSALAFRFYTDSDETTDIGNSCESIILQCIDSQGNTFIETKGSSNTYIDNVANGVYSRILPLSAYIPKYRESGYDSEYPWLPYMHCGILNGIPDQANCVTTINENITAGSEGADLNTLISLSDNQFPHITPNGGFPFSKLVSPEPIPLRMVFDGSPIETEELVLQNKFELTGTIDMEPGDEGTFLITTPIGGGRPIVTTTDGTVLNDGDQVIIPDLDIVLDLVFNPDTGDFTGAANTINLDYAGTGLIVRDPIRGTETSFTKELAVDDIIELSFPERRIGGSFFSTGDNTIYYRGQHFPTIYKDNTKIEISGVEYKLTNMETFLDADNKSILQQESVLGLSLLYDAKFTTDGTLQVKSKEVTTDLFSTVNESVNLIPSPVNRLLGTIEFTNQNYQANRYFEVGDLVTIQEYGGGRTFKYRFGNIRENRLEGAYIVLDANDVIVPKDQANLDNGFSNGTLTRGAKITRALESLQGAKSQGFKMYHKIREVTSDTEIEVTPAYSENQSYVGKINRLGFNIMSNSESPDLLNSGFDVEGAGSFLLKGSATGADSGGNSIVFHVPKANTEKVILYRNSNADFTKIPDETKTIKDTANVAAALESFIDVYNYNTFTKPLGTPIYEEDLKNQLNQSRIGSLYFTDGEDPYIVLETIENSNPISHGFGDGDILKIRKVKNSPLPTDDPYGTLVNPSDDSANLNFIDYNTCGLDMLVQEVVSPYRFKVLKKGRKGYSNAHLFFNRYDKDTENTLFASNGDVVDYWMKYFQTVYMDGTTTANSLNEYNNANITRSTYFASKGVSASSYQFNYNAFASKLDFKLGTTALNISINSSTNVLDFDPNIGTTSDGTFILSLKTPLNSPPQLLDSYFIRLVEYEEI